MKLEMSLPERPGWMFVIPGFDFVALLLALTMLTGVVKKEGFIDLQLPLSELQATPIGSDRPVIVMLKSTLKDPTYLVGGKSIAPEDLKAAVEEALQSQETKTVALLIDRRVSTDERWVLLDLLGEIEIEGLRVGDVIVRDQASEEKPDDAKE